MSFNSLLYLAIQRIYNHVLKTSKKIYSYPVNDIIKPEYDVLIPKVVVVFIQ